MTLLSADKTLFGKTVTMCDDDGYKCPVCENFTLGEYGGYEICPICGWEDDLSQRKYPDSGGGANVLILNDYKKKYLSIHSY